MSSILIGMIGTMYLEVTQLNLGSIHSIQSRNFNSLSHVNTKEIPIGYNMQVQHQSGAPLQLL